MIKNILLIFFAFIPFTAFCINIEVSFFSFYGSSPYTEIYFRIDGKTIDWTQHQVGKNTSVDILFLVYNQDGDIAAYDKFSLTSAVTDTICDFIGIKRIRLQSGEYTLKVEASETSRPDNKIEMEKKMVIENPLQQFMLSDILILGKLKKAETDHTMAKNGYYMEPLSFNFASQKLQQLDFYIESYLPQNIEAIDYFLQYNIMEGFTTDIKSKPLLSKYKKLTTNSVEPLILSFSLSSLRSGDYHVLVNIIDKKKNSLCSRTINFIRSNPEADIAYLESYNETLDNSFVNNIKKDELEYILKAHVPVTEQHQISTLSELIRSNKTKSQKQFIFQYWKSKTSTNPEEAFKKYMEVASAVDKMFYSNVGFGFQSDRGYIFLKYGKPSSVITVDTEVDAPPYEIWYYNYLSLSKQTNVRFLFYNPSLAHNDFRLLHSTCLGEKINPAWETELYKSVPKERIGNTVDATQVVENTNRNARRYFNEF